MNKSLIYIPAFAALTSLLVAERPPNTGSAELPPQSTAIKGVLVPVPREIFDMFDKFANSNWRVVQRPEFTKQSPHPNQAETALLLGVVIAEGFIAVEAEDTGEVKTVGRAVLKLARGLGVEKAALKRSSSIVEHAEHGDWSGVRKEWDGVLPDVQQGMNELQSEQLAQLVSLGGWLRGTEALTALVLQSDWARPGPPDRSSSPGSKLYRLAARAPSACRDDRTWRPGPRQSRGYGWY